MFLSNYFQFFSKNYQFLSNYSQFLSNNFQFLWKYSYFIINNSIAQDIPKMLEHPVWMFSAMKKEGKVTAVLSIASQCVKTELMQVLWKTFLRSKPCMDHLELAKKKVQLLLSYWKKIPKCKKPKQDSLFFPKLRKLRSWGSFFRDPPLVKRNFMAGAHHNIDIITVAEREGELRH